MQFEKADNIVMTIREKMDDISRLLFRTNSE